MQLLPAISNQTSSREYVIQSMKNNPEYVLESVLANAPEYVAENLRNHHGIQVIAEDPDSIIQGIGSVLINENLGPRETLQRILNVPIIYDRLNDTGRAAVYEASGPMTLPFAKTLLDDSFDIENETFGLPDDWQVGGGSTGSDPSGWINVVNGLLPGILQIFGIGNTPQAPGTSPDYSQIYAMQEAERLRSERTNRIILYSIIGIFSVVALFFGIRLLNKK